MNRSETLRTVDVDGIATRYYEEGSGPPVLLVHGGDYRAAVTGHHEWAPVVTGLSSKYRVIAVDKLGQGYTDNPKLADYTLQAVCEHLAKFVETLNLRNLSVIAHSLGCIPAAILAMDAPERVRSLTMFSAGSLMPEDHARPKGFYERAYANPPAVPDLAYQAREPIMNSHSLGHVTEEYLAGRMRVARQEKFDIATRAMSLGGYEHFKSDLQKVKLETLRRISSGHLTCDSLVVWGNDDPSGPNPGGWSLYELISNAVVTQSAQFHVLSKCGHYPFLEQPSACVRLLKGFLHDEDRTTVEAR